ncbi:MAG TPA: 4'-phosphopantetheinyl transferase superfamily protein [Acidimicrobiales bacterium]|nr:4'-phosphopantetheinyl transferase superfamily protein [Acidimicrobiales bacterium]
MLRLAHQEVHVWTAPAAQAPEVASLLDAGERARAARLRFERDRALFTAAHGLLRLLLAAYLDEAPQALRFEVAEHGKPFLVGRPDVSFNLSHSGDLALVALATGRQVGVDVEHSRPIRGEEGVARRVMTDGELARYLSLEAGDRRSFLLRVWARKEALVKASGLGIRASLTAVPSEPGPSDAWSVADLDIPGYAAAVAAAGSDWRPVLRDALSVPRWCRPG